MQFLGLACHLINDFNYLYVLYSNENMIQEYQPVIPDNQLVMSV